MLDLPVLATICLLSSSLSVALGARALSGPATCGDRASGSLVTVLLGAYFSRATAREWYGLIYRQRLTIGTNLFGTTFYPLVGPARLPRHHRAQHARASAVVFAW